MDVQTIFILVSCDDYIFHYPAEKQDIKELQFKQKIGTIRKPRSEMSYSMAKRILLQYVQ